MNEELKLIISAEIGKLKAKIDAAKQQVNSFKEQVNKAKADTDNNYKAIGESIGNGLKKAAALGVAAVAAVGTALVGASAATADYRKNQAQLTAAFEQAKLGAESATGVYRELYGVIGDDDQAVESAANIAMLADSEKEAAKWAELAAGIVGTFHDTLQPEAFYEAANETLKLGEATGAFTQMLEQTGVMSVDDFNAKLAACTTEAEKQALMLSVTQNAVGAAGESYKKSAADIIAQNEAQAKLTDNLAKLGEAVAPVITAFTNLANEALAKVIPYIQELAEKYAPMIQPALEKVAEVTGKIFSYIAENWQFLTAMAGIIGGIAIAIGLYNAVAAIKAAMAAAEVTTVWGLVAAYAAQAAAMIVAIAPYLLIVAAIAAVIAIIVLCVKHWDDIKAAVAKAWDFIKEKTSAAVEAVKGFFADMKEKISNIITAIKETVTAIFSAIKQVITNYIQMAKDIVLSIFEGIKAGIQNKIETVKNIISNVVKLIKAIFTGDFGAAKDALLGIFDSIKNGIKNKLDNAKNTVKNVIDAIKGFFNFKWELPKLKMPSIKITGKFSLSPLQVPKFSIKWNALGGVFDKPTLFNYGGSLQGIGEAGAEAVVPLENNLGWLDKMAGMLANKLGSGKPVYLTVDGKILGQITCDSINNLTRQTGSLPLVIA